MDIANARKLNAINRSFYERNAQSFSATRTCSWPGWERLLSHGDAPRDVLDLACGNMRFQKHVLKVFPHSHPTFYCVDSCEDLVDPAIEVRFQKLDIVEAVLDGAPLAALIDAPECDLSVSMGFLHHVPGMEARKTVLGALACKTRPGGCLCVSLWRFMDDRKQADKARRSTENALARIDVSLDQGDYLLGWQGLPGTFRYCHSFSDDEVDALAASVAQTCVLVDRFEADGASNAMNTYLVLRKRA